MLHRAAGHVRRLWQRQDAGGVAMQRVRDAALQAMGAIVIGRPTLMLEQLQPGGLADQPASSGEIGRAHV